MLRVPRDLPPWLRARVGVCVEHKGVSGKLSGCGPEDAEAGVGGIDFVVLFALEAALVGRPVSVLPRFSTTVRTLGTLS